jgi:hypothetical protein
LAWVWYVFVVVAGVPLSAHPQQGIPLGYGLYTIIPIWLLVWFYIICSVPFLYGLAEMRQGLLLDLVTCHRISV